MPKCRSLLALAAGTLALAASSPAQDAPEWDMMADTWVAIDGLGRELPTHAEVGPPREDKVVAMFYFLWLGRHINGGPHDITKILEQNPGALNDTNHPAWGPMHAFHHWGQSALGYYQSEDRHVLRKHAQMLADAGVDVLVFDCSNNFDYPESYWPLLETFREMRDAGNDTPQIAFLSPFGNAGAFVERVYKAVYEPDDQQWTPVNHIAGYAAEDGAVTITISGGDPYIESRDGLGINATNYRRLRVRLRNETIATEAEFFFRTEAEPSWSGDKRVGFAISANDAEFREYVIDLGSIPKWAGTVTQVRLDPNVGAPGVVRLELLGIEPTNADLPNQHSWWFGHNPFWDLLFQWEGKPLMVSNRNETTDPVIRDFFTFRRPMPDYQNGPSGTNQWSWLEVYPQHVFASSSDPKEQMSVGVAQNAVDLPNGTVRAPAGFQEPNARGRAFWKGSGRPDTDPLLFGHNFQQQWERALEVDPRVIFVTQWNEWTAMRFTEFNGVSAPVVFVDVFTQELSRCAEPMLGGHGDNYYHQLIANIRRFKGAREIPVASAPKRIAVDGDFGDWDDVGPSFRDTADDEVRRNGPIYASTFRYINNTGRNDIVESKATWDAGSVYFMARTREALSPSSGAEWMILYIDADGDATTGWEGFDYRVLPERPAPGLARVQRNVGGAWEWSAVGPGTVALGTDRLELALPRGLLPEIQEPVTFDFKWSDNIAVNGDPMRFLLDGDAAPNDRYRWRYIALEGATPPPTGEAFMLR